jgi:translin
LGRIYLSLKTILDQIQKELRKKDVVRDEVQKAMRLATRLSKQAILLTHQEKLGAAKKLLNEVSQLFIELQKKAKNNPDMLYIGMVEAAFQEYVEAQTLIHLVEENRFIDPKELGVPVVSYVLGLADVIGEFRRRVLDLLRRGNVKTAENCLQIMENIHIELMSMDEAYILVPGLRRKCDVGRHIIESTRGDITIEARRSSLEQCIKKLEKIVRSKKKR